MPICGPSHTPLPGTQGRFPPSGYVTHPCEPDSCVSLHPTPPPHWRQDYRLGHAQPPTTTGQAGSSLTPKLQRCAALSQSWAWIAEVCPPFRRLHLPGGLEMASDTCGRLAPFAWPSLLQAHLRCCGDGQSWGRAPPHCRTDHLWSLPVFGSYERLPSTAGSRF